MATEEAERGPGSSVVSARSSSLPSRSAPPNGTPWNLRGSDRRPEAHRYSDRRLPSTPSEGGCNHGNPRRSPSLLSYRKLSYGDAGSRGEGTFLDADCARNAAEMLPAQNLAGKRVKGVIGAVARLAGRGPESSLGQSDGHDDDDEAGSSARQKAGSARCACPVSRFQANCSHSPGSNSNSKSYTSPAHSSGSNPHRRSNVSTSHNPGSNPTTKSTTSPVHCSGSNPSPGSNICPALSGCRTNPRPRSRPTQMVHHHVRRSSLPASMLASHKVITPGLRRFGGHCVKANSIGSKTVCAGEAESLPESMGHF